MKYSVTLFNKTVKTILFKFVCMLKNIYSNFNDEKLQISIKSLVTNVHF